MKLPSGSTDRLREEFSKTEIEGAPASGIHGYDLTLGTGSVDGIIGTGIYARWKRCFFTANTQYAIRSTGDFDYRFANDLTWSGGPGVYLMMNHQSTLGVQLNISGENKARDTFQGVRAADTGVTFVFVGPQINFTWANKLSAEIGIDLPVSIDNTALQAVPDFRVRAGLSWHF